MLQHYFHESYQFRTKRRNLRQFKMNTSKTKSIDCNQKFVCMSNGNAIEIYKISSESVDFYMRKQFFCNITKIQIIPSLHHDSDYIFILDELGRFSFWRPGQCQKQTCNVIQKQNTSKRFYRQQLSPEEQEEFSGSAFQFDVKDTIGHIFFTVQNKLTLLNISVKLRQGLKINYSRTYQIPYTRFRFVNCLNIPGAKQVQVFIGIIQELEQKTILKIHVLNLQISSTLIDQQSLSYKIQKTNLLSFQSGQNDEIIVLTYDEISLYKYRQSPYLCNYRTRGNYGSVCYISPNSHKAVYQATYIHLGFDMTVFTKSRLHSYGPLKLDGKNVLQNRGILQSKYLGHVSSGQVMLGFVTNFNEVYFVLLYENKWRLVRQIQSLSSIFSMHELNRDENNNSMIVVHASQENNSQVTHVEITSPTILDQEQVIDKLIETIDLVQEGQSLIVVSQGQSSLLSWQDGQKHWVQHFGFNNMKQQILACTGAYVVMTSGIYKYEINQSNELTMNQLLKEDNILSAVTNKQYIGYYTSEGNYKFYEFQSNSIARIRKNCIEEYIWHMLSGKNILISAAYNELGQLRILPVQKVAKKIQLQTKQLVSSISSISYSADKKDQKMIDESSQDGLMTDLVVGFHSGDVEIYSLDQDKTVAKFNIGAQMVNVTSYRSTHVIVYTPTKQYILSKHIENKQPNKKQFQNGKIYSQFSVLNQYKMNQVEFSDKCQQISKILYLEKFDKFLVLLSTLASPHSSLIQLRSLKLHKRLSDNELTLQLNSTISMKTLFKSQNGEDIPFIEVVNDEFIYVALPESIFKYCIRTKQLVKKQLHLLKQIVGIQKIQAGIIVTGVDMMESGYVVLFDYEDLSIKGTYNLGPSKPSCIKSFKNSSKYPNRFLIHHETYLTLLETQPTHLITSLKTINTKTQSSSIDLNEKFNKLLLTDQYRYLSVWDYDLEVVSQDFIPVSKYFGAYMLNDCCWLDGAVVTGDRGGNLAVMQFNLGNNIDLHKINMTKVAQIYVGEEIFTLRKVQSNKKSLNQYSQQQIEDQKAQVKQSAVYYGTSSGTIGLVKTISEQQFKLLKQIELDTIKYIDNKEHFSYEQWRKRIPKNDKLIDSSVIKYYLDELRNKVKMSQQDFYNDVSNVYNSLIGGLVNGKNGSY